MADLVPTQYDGAHLADELIKRLLPGDEVLLLRSVDGGEELPRRLQDENIAVVDVPLYHTIRGCAQGDLLRERLIAETLDYVIFTSASTVEGFVQSVGDAPLSGFTALCIGAVTERAAKRYGMKTKTAKNAAIDDLIDCCLMAAQEIRR